jgi:hypothetical protein
MPHLADRGFTDDLL